MTIEADLIVVEVQSLENPKEWTEIDKWQQYEITQRVGEGAGVFTLQPTPTSDVLEKFTSGGQKVRIHCNGAEQFNGVTDEISKGGKTDGRFIHVSGRDMAGILVDSAAPRTGLAGLTLANLALKLADPWIPDYIQGVLADDSASFYKMISGTKKYSGRATPKTSDTTFRYVDKSGTIRYKGGKKSPYYRGVDQDKLRQTRIRAGEKIWEVLARFAGQCACTIYMTSDANLFIGRPSYDRLHYPKLKLLPDGSGNVLAATFEVSIAERYSEYTFTSQGRARSDQKGTEVNHKVSVRDPGPPFWKLATDGSLTQRFYKPGTIEVRKGTKDSKLLRRLARSTVEENAIKSYKYEIELPGHEASNGLLWSINSCVEVEDRINNRYGDHYIKGRRFRKAIGEGTLTVLELVPANIWLGLDHDTVSDTAWDESMRIWLDF